MGKKELPGGRDMGEDMNVTSLGSLSREGDEKIKRRRAAKARRKRCLFKKIKALLTALSVREDGNNTLYWGDDPATP